MSILSRNMSYIGRRARRYYAIIYETGTARLCGMVSNSVAMSVSASTVKRLKRTLRAGSLLYVAPGG